MAKLVFGMNQSLDGYVDHLEMRTGPALFRHWIEHVRDLTGSVYGRRMYEAMRYWDEDRPEWGAEQHEFAAAWRRQPKWVVSRSLKSVGPNATLVEDDIEAVIRGLKARLVGEIAVSGPDLARSVTDLGLIDEYRLYFHPVVLGRGKPFFAGPRPPLRLPPQVRRAYGLRMARRERIFTRTSTGSWVAATWTSSSRGASRWASPPASFPAWTPAGCSPRSTREHLEKLTPLSAE